MTKAEKYIRNQEAIKTRAIFAIFKKQKALFIEKLLALQEKKAYSLKAVNDDFIDPYLDEIAKDVPEYLLTVLPTIMVEGASESIARYIDLLPDDYGLVFDLPGEPAAEYLNQLEDLMLSQRQGSILKTTRDELRGIIARGATEGSSYGEIAKQIQETDPFVFSKARANLISVNEIGRAYGWANHQPALDLMAEGYILEKEWQTKHDDKVRPNHVANEKAGAIPLMQAFPGTGDQFAPSTREIRCRCTSTHKIVGIKTISGVQKIEKGTPVEAIKKLFEILKK